MCGWQVRRGDSKDGPNFCKGNVGKQGTLFTKAACWVPNTVLGRNYGTMSCLRETGILDGDERRCSLLDAALLGLNVGWCVWRWRKRCRIFKPVHPSPDNRWGDTILQHNGYLWEGGNVPMLPCLYVYTLFLQVKYKSTECMLTSFQSTLPGFCPSSKPGGEINDYRCGYIPFPWQRKLR